MRLSMVRVSDIPVAIGTRKHSLTLVTPEILITSSSMELVSLLIRLEPAALGWTWVRSPDRPIPCPRP